MTNKTILFIDDSPVDRAFIQSLLVKNDFSVLLAQDGQEGIDIAHEKRPDLILLDILLPGISGIEVCKRLKEDPTMVRIPVIFYTSADAPKGLTEYAAYGAIDYLPKNMPPQDLINSIRKILSIV